MGDLALESLGGDSLTDRRAAQKASLATRPAEHASAAKRYP